MRASTTVTETGAEVYEHEIMELVDQYLSTLDNPERIYDNNKGLFTGMIKYIYINYFKNNPINHDDADMVYSYWTIYTMLCYKYNKRPTILNFSIFSGIDRSTFDDWKNGEYRGYIYYDSDNNRITNVGGWRLAHPGQEPRKELSRKHADTVKRMLAECESALFDGAMEQGNIGCIFGLKAGFGWAETAPVPTANHNQRVLSASELPRLDGMETARLPEIAGREVGENGN